MTSLIVTIIISAIFFGMLGVSLLLGRLCGRVRPRRCACAEARAIMKQYEDRSASARRAARYSAEQVDPHRLPLLDQGGKDS